MRYILLMHGTRTDWPALAPTPDDLRGTGELIAGAALAPPDQAAIVRAGGSPLVTRAPFAAAREFLAGFWLVDCDGPGRAIEIAAALSGSARSAIELRPVLRAPGEEM
jgi:hypothetical protein